MAELRRVAFLSYIDETGDRTEVRSNGLTGKFHQWGEVSSERDAGIMRSTVAIVEADDGTVYCAHPASLKFIEHDPQYGTGI